MGLGALTLFAAGSLAMAIVHTKREEQLKLNYKRNQELEWKIRDQIRLHGTYHRTEAMESELAKMRDRLRLIDKRIEQLEIHNKVEQEPVPQTYVAPTNTVRMGKVASAKVVYKGVELLGYIESIEKELDDLKKTLRGINYRENGCR